MLEAKEVYKSYNGLEVLKGINLSVNKGEVISIVGASGAGKSTLLHLLGTLDAPDRGTISIAGKHLERLGSHQLSTFRNEQIGFIFQFHNLFPEFTALENVCIPGYIAGKPKAEVQKRAKELLQLLGLGDRLEHKPNELSGGQRQRLAIARALMTDPKLLILDEATSALDYESERLIRQNLNRIKANRTLLIIAHRLSTVEQCDVLLVMEKGQVVEVGSHHELMKQDGLYAYLARQQQMETTPYAR